MDTIDIRLEPLLFDLLYGVFVYRHYKNYSSYNELTALFFIYLHWKFQKFEKFQESQNFQKKLRRFSFVLEKCTIISCLSNSTSRCFEIGKSQISGK